MSQHVLDSSVAMRLLLASKNKADQAFGCGLGLSRAYNLSSYDAAYLELAIREAQACHFAEAGSPRYTLGLTPAIREKPLVISIGKIAERSIKSLLFML
jgi:hypothetical protein